MARGEAASVERDDDDFAIVGNEAQARVMEQLPDATVVREDLGSKEPNAGASGGGDERLAENASETAALKRICDGESDLGRLRRIVQTDEARDADDVVSHPSDDGHVIHTVHGYEVLGKVCREVGQRALKAQVAGLGGEAMDEGLERRCVASLHRPQRHRSAVAQSHFARDFTGWSRRRLATVFVEVKQPMSSNRG
jgi:hypothetical protein